MPPTSTCRGTLSDHLAPEDIVPFTPLSDADWNEVRADATRILLRQFCTVRNLWVHRGTYILDMLGYAWAGIYRSLLVGSIVTTPTATRVTSVQEIGSSAPATSSGAASCCAAVRRSSPS